MYNYQKAKEDYQLSQKKDKPRLPPVLNGVFMDLPSRKISKATCEFYNYQVGTFSGVVGNEVYTDTQCHISNLGNDHLIQKLRLPSKTFLWTGGAHSGELFGQHLFVPNKERFIIVTEGELDAMSIYEITGYAAVSITGGAQSAVNQLRKNLDWLTGWKQVLLWFDKDEPGADAVQAVATADPPLFDPAQVAQIITPHVTWKDEKGAIHTAKDASDLRQHGKEVELKRAIWNPQPIVSSLFRDLSDLETYRHADDSSTVIAPWAWPSLTKKIRGFRAGITIVIADPGIGKSTFCNTNVMHWASTGTASVVVALEDSFKDNQKKLLSQTAATNLTYLDNEDYYTQASLVNVLPGMVRIFDHKALPEPDVLDKAMKLEARSRECKVFVLDNLTYLVDGLDPKDPNTKTAQIMTNLREFTKNLNVGVLLIVHTKSPEDKVEKIRKLTIWDSLWSKSVGRYCTMMLALERDIEDESHEVWLRGLKDRAGLAVGYLIKLKFDGLKYVEVKELAPVGSLPANVEALLDNTPNVPWENEK